MLDIQLAREHAAFEADEARLRTAVANVLAEAGVARATVSLAIVDDDTISRINAQFLQHAGPTDVLSFLLEQRGDVLEGEIVVSADTADRMAAQLGWPAGDELLLYVIHGALHLVGYDDQQEPERQQMRGAERRHLASFGLSPPNHE